MTTIKKITSIVLVATMLMGITGCSDKKDNGKGSSADKEVTKEASNDMKMIKDTIGDEEKCYFIDGNGQLKVYSGYNRMSDFRDGISMVEVNNDEYSGYMLIDKDENVKVKANEMEHFEYYRNGETIAAYRVINEDRVSGIYGPKGDMIADYQYEYVFGTDIDWVDFEIIVGKKEDTSLDIYSLDGKLVYTVPAGYAEEGYGYSGVILDSHRSEENILKIAYGDVVKLIRMDTYEELPVEKFTDFYNGAILTDTEVVLYNSNFEEVKKIAYNKSEKDYKNVFNSEDGQIYALEYTQGWDRNVDVYNINGDLIYSGEGDFAKIWENGEKSYYKYRNEDREYVLIDSTGKELFKSGSNEDIYPTLVEGIFYTKITDEVCVYDMDTMERYNDVVYKSVDEAGIFYGEDHNLVIAEDGSSYISEKKDGEMHYNCVKMFDRYYVYEVEKDGERSKCIVDLNGSKKVVEVPYEARFNEDFPYYTIEKVYYNFEGKEIIDIENIKK